MIIRTVRYLAFVAACVTTIAALPAAQAEMVGDTTVMTNAPQPMPAYTSGGWWAQRNVVQSQRYDHRLETDRAFRHARMRKECGPISDPMLRADCLASFSQDEPFVGSSTPPRHYGSGAGR